MRTEWRPGVAGLSLVLALTSCVLADGGKHGRGSRRAEDAVVFGPRERAVVADYYGEPRHGCPPGLAKKHNGCLPPGQAKKRYAVGYPLPRNAEVLSLPRELEIRIGLPPPGYRYAVVDGDVVKLAVGTLLVVDAISSMTR